MKKRLGRSLALSAILAITGCSATHQQPGSQTAVETEQKDPTTIVAQRAEAYWTHRTKQRFEEAYLYETPQLRQEVTLTNYIKGMASGMVIRAVLVQSVEIENDIATVNIRINFYSIGAIKPKEGITREIADYWQLIDGVWYHIFRRP